MKKLISMFLMLVFVGFTSLAFAQQTQETEDGEEDENLLTVVDLGTNEEYQIEIDPNLALTPGTMSNEPPDFVSEEPAAAQATTAILDNGSQYLSGTEVSVIGKADWYQTRKKAVVAFMYKNGNEFCSGALVGPYAVLTAAHCIINQKTGDYYHLSRDMVAYPGGTAGGVGRIPISSTTLVPKKYLSLGKGYTNAHIPHDYAIVLLQKPIGNQINYFSVADPFLTIGTKIAVWGFPGSKSHRLPWFSPGEITNKSFQSDHFEHSADTLPGSSGAPVFKMGHYSEIIAVNVSHGLNGTYNVATRPSWGGLVSFVNEHKFSTPQKSSARKVNKPKKTPRKAGSTSRKSGKTNGARKPGKTGHYRKTAYNPDEDRAAVIQQVSLELNRK